jgi:hypothetical protein
MVFESGYVQLCVMKVKKTLSVSFWLAAFASKKSFEAKPIECAQLRAKYNLHQTKMG